MRVESIVQALAFACSRRRPMQHLKPFPIVSAQGEARAKRAFVRPSTGPGKHELGTWSILRTASAGSSAVATQCI